MSKKSNSSALIGGLLVGSALGTLFGLLIAPRKGEETRKIVKKSAQALPELVEDLSTSLQLQAHRLSSTTLENWEGTMVRLKDAIAAGLEASEIEDNEAEISPEQTANASSPDVVL